MDTKCNTVTFTLSQDEYAAAGKFSLLLLYSKPSGRVVLYGGIAIAILVISTVASALRGDDVPWVQYGLVFLAVAGMLALSYFLTVPAAFRRNHANHPHLRGPMTWSWDRSGFSVATENSHSRLRWTDVFRFAENGQFILIYPMPRLMYILPKRSLTAAQIDELRSLARLPMLR